MFNQKINQTSTKQNYPFYKTVAGVIKKFQEYFTSPPINILWSESRRLKHQANSFFKIEHKVHVMYSLTACSFQQIIYT